MTKFAVCVFVRRLKLTYMVVTYEYVQYVKLNNVGILKVQVLISI